MKLYDESIKEIYGMLSGKPERSLDVSGTDSDWQDAGKGNMILRGDMAYELGGGTSAALSCLSLTEDKTLVTEDEVLLYGQDLPEISQDISYARLAFVRVKEGSLGDGNELYNGIRKIEYVRYHLNPKGYMIRISPSNDREPARIGKDALAEGLDFAKVGKLFLKAYHENPKIEAVKLVFVTLSDFPYRRLAELIKKNEQITAAVDHIMKDLVMDCGVCSLKPVCDEVEGMRELHFAQTGKMSGL